ncbi:hypothetical protein JG688_00008551 [Phytophthora aleatoria]|uniref:Uncharacterized protein n=1 Tax=Phytophthora aleatoria TaxID=2496075 RepID=A0A8J5MFN9_9STRA|nr:hypothetical protein JG688_00008551 [Phytophthora aleatoria]
MNSRYGNSDSGYYGLAPVGLVVMAPDGREKLVMSDQEICDDIVATVPKLKTAVTHRVRRGAKAELRCHLNEVLTVLVTHESMKALVGKKFKKGDVLFNQHRLLSQDLRRQSMVASRLDMEKEEAPKLALIGVNIATLRPRIPMDLGGNRKTQKLCFSTFTQQYPGQDRAVHIMKTLPKELHDQLIPTNTHVTRIFAHGYASPTPPTQFGTSSITPNPSEIARRRESVMNPEAKHVLNVLTKSLRQFERVVRRRRFGFQTFIYFPTGYDDPSLEKRVLPVPSASTSSVATSSATYLVQALGPAVVAVDDALWYNDDGDTASMASDSSSVEELTEQLYLDDPASTRTLLISSVNCKDKRSKNYTKTQQVAQDVENYLSQSLRVMKDRYSSVGQYTVADLEERDNVFEFDADQTKAEHHPMPPMPARKKEARRLEAIEQMGVLQPEYDHAALDLVAQVAAKRLNCPIGFVSVVDDDNFHAIGTYNLPQEAFTLPRSNNVCIHAEKPLILKNPTRDMRFNQMPCT